MHPRILIVDDEALFMRALCDNLRERGYEVVGYISSAEALADLRTNSYDLMLVDLMMPGTDGISVVQEACRIDPELACIIMTGEGSVASAVQAMKIGALDYVVKPFKISTIIPVLARALETRNLRIKNTRLERQLREHVAELYAVNRSLDVARKQAEKANREKSAFLSNMSHELRTPLNAILGFSRILVDDTMTVAMDQRKDFANDILQAGSHLLTLINEILDLAKVESGMLLLSMESVAIADVLHECHTMIEPLASRREIQLLFPSNVLFYVRADRTRLKQVLINLLSNAIKYNREQGAVSVNCMTQGDGRVHISVQDTGTGLNAQQLEEIFQPFNRLGREAYGEEGTGIGLVLTKRIVEAMQGTISVTSLQGIGSTFQIDLEIAKPPLTVITDLHSTVTTIKYNDEQIRLLYIEDNPANLKLVKELVRLQFGSELMCALDAPSGIAIARSELPHVVLMDINLPGMDGYEAHRLLQEDALTAHIPVIAVTASAMSEELRNIKGAGFFRCVTKPIDVSEFVEAIESALKIRIELHKPIIGV
jgi:signal transduction histidine kinase